MALKPVVMPQLGESVVEATLTTWHVREGEVVQRDQTIAEASTDKADTELPAPFAGRVVRLLVQEGQTVPVNTPIVEVETDVEAKPAPTAAPARPQAAPSPKEAAAPKEATAKEPAPKEPAVAAAPVTPSPAPARVESTGKAAASAAPLASQISPGIAPHEPAAKAERPAVERGREERTREERTRASPLVRRIAREQSVDLSQLEGSGASGRVTKKDILDHLASRTGAPETPPPPRRAQEGRMAAREARAPREEPRPAPVSEPAAPRPAPAELRVAPGPAAGLYKPPEYRPMPGDEVVPFTRRRQLIAEHMVYSKQTSPHVGCMTEVDLHRVDVARKAAAKSGTKISFLAYVAAAMAKAVREYPVVNAVVLEKATVLRKVINLGVAIDTDEGLVVAVVKKADELSLVGLTNTIAELAEKGRQGKLTADELTGGTITLSNPGTRGNTWGMAVINQPQVAIVRMGEIIKRPWVVSVDGEDAIVIRPIMNLVLSYDHRVIDGVAANGFLRRIKELLEGEPGKL